MYIIGAVSTQIVPLSREPGGTSKPQEVLNEAP